MLDIAQPTDEVVAAIESLRPARQPKPLTRENCTTPELRLEYIARWLEAGGDARHGIAGFAMHSWVRTKDCGTTCCIGGSACLFWGNKDMDWVANYSVSSDAAGLLGMPPEKAYRLFFPGSDRTPHGIPCINAIMASPAWAARCIRHYQKTGVVCWEGTR